MKFVINRNSLYKVLQRTKNASATAREAHESAIVSLSFRNYIFTAETDKLTIETSNSQIYMTEAVSIENYENADGSPETFAIFAPQLLTVIKTLENQPLLFTLHEYQVTVTHSLGTFALPLEDTSEYRGRKRISLDEGKAQYVQFEAPGLLSLLNRCSFAMANDYLRPVMNGVIVNMTNEFTDFAASDGHKLVRIRKKPMPIDKPATMVLSRRIVKLLQNVLPCIGFVDVWFIPYDPNDEHPHAACRMVFGNTELCFTLIEGRYPNYNSVIPETSTILCTVARQAVIKSFERLCHFSGDSDYVLISIADNRFSMKAKDADYQIEASEAVPCKYDGEPFKIAFKTQSMVQVLKSIKCDNVILQMADRGRAVNILPEVQPDNEQVLMLLMPMLVRDEDE